MSNVTPFHAGERAVQTQLGVRQQIEPFAQRVVRNFMPEEHRSFYAQLPFMVAAARDRDERPWVTLLAGAPGFIETPDSRTLDIHSALSAGDALQGQLNPGQDIGLLGLEFDTRRRNRINGRIAAHDEQHLRVEVSQSFGNCPQYIQPRSWQPAPAKPAEVSRHHALTATAVEWIERADTFFIGSGYRASQDAASFGMDASHRGGAPGFVRVTSANTLVFPDYAGNNHFNTIGNLVMDPRVALLYVDFAAGHMLQLTGRAEIDWDSPAVAEVPGARRLVHIRIEQALELRHVLPLVWTAGDRAMRSLQVQETVQESDDVVSFLLGARDGGALPDFEPGQHLPIELNIPGQTNKVTRTYSLSAAPNEASYRLSIKREAHGVASNYMHTEVQPGSTISAAVPAGDFYLKPGARPVVLISAGVGVTPMTSMLGHLVNTKDTREVWFVHGARNSRQHVLADEVAALGKTRANLHTHIAYSQPLANDSQGRDYDSRGRVDPALLKELLPDLDADFYLCGPVAFMGALQAGLMGLGVPDEQIHSETFGPSS